MADYSQDAESSVEGAVRPAPVRGDGGGAGDVRLGQGHGQAGRLHRTVSSLRSAWGPSGWAAQAVACNKLSGTSGDTEKNGQAELHHECSRMSFTENRGLILSCVTWLPWAHIIRGSSIRP